jgi:hypothetical protein
MSSPSAALVELAVVLSVALLAGAYAVGLAALWHWDGLRQLLSGRSLGTRLVAPLVVAVVLLALGPRVPSAFDGEAGSDDL